FSGLPFQQLGSLQNFSPSGVSLIDRITCDSYTVVALGPCPPIVWRSVVSRSLNKVMLIGNLGADPEVRSTNNGSRVANLSLATSRQWTGQGGEKQEKAAAKVAPEGKAESLDALPEALDEEDDDLPF